MVLVATVGDVDDLSDIRRAPDVPPVSLTDGIALVRAAPIRSYLAAASAGVSIPLSFLSALS